MIQRAGAQLQQLLLEAVVCEHNAGLQLALNATETVHPIYTPMNWMMSYHAVIHAELIACMTATHVFCRGISIIAAAAETCMCSGSTPQ